MADNKKIYSIQINGIEQSIKQVDALSDSLQALDKKIKELESRSVSVTSSSNTSSSNNSSELQTEDKLLKQIQNTEEQIRNARREDYQSLLAQKETLKDIVSEAEKRAAAERLSAGNYDNNMKGLKQELSDIKKVMQTTDLGDEKFQEMTQRASELTNKLKELEQAYGQFGRNVGNYKSAFDDIKKVTVQIGDTSREFNSVRDASRQLSQELKAMVINGQDNTEEFEQLAEAVHNFEMATKKAESAVNDLKASSKGMDDMLDVMESFGSLGQISQGFSALLGLDDTEIERSIQKLVGLQNAMQGIEKIRQQMNTGEGIGGVLTKGFSKIDALQSKLMQMNTSLNGVGKTAKVAAVGIKAFSTALKGLASLGILAVIDLLVEGISKLSELVSSWIKGDADLIDSTAVLNSSIQKQNDLLNKNLQLIQKRSDAGELSAMDTRIEKEKAYAEALKETAEALKKRQKTYEDADIADTNKSGINLSNVLGDKGVTTLGGFSEGIKNINEFTERFDYLVGRVENGQDIFDGFLDTESDARDELVHLTKLVGGDFYNAMGKFADGTTEGAKKLVEYIAQMDKLTSGKYFQAIKLGVDQGYFDGQIKQAWDLYERFKTDVQLDPIEIRLNFESLANQFIEAADKTKSAYYKRQKEALQDAYDQLGDAATEEDKKLLDQALAAIDKQATETRKSAIASAKKTAAQEKKQVENAQKELNQTKIALMKEGLNKTLKQLEEERRQKIAKIRADGIMTGELELATNQLYDKKIEDAKKKHAENMKKIYEDMWNTIFSLSLSNSKKESETVQNAVDEAARAMEEAKNKLMNQGISSYGIQGAEQLSPSTQKALGIASTNNDEVIEDYKKLIDIQREYSMANNAYATAKIKANDEIEEAEKELAQVEEETNKKLEQLEKDKVFMFEDEYESKKHEIENELDVEQARVNKLKENWDKEEQLLKMTLDAKETLYNEYNAELEQKYSTEEQQLQATYAYNALLEESYSKDLLTAFNQRMTSVQAYWTARISSEKTNAEALLEVQKAYENESYESERRELLDKQQKFIDSNAKRVENEELTQQELAEINEANERMAVETSRALINLDTEHNQKLKELEAKKTETLKSINAEYYQDALQEFRDFQTSISQLEEKAVVRNEQWGMTNLSKTNKNNRELLASYETMAQKIIEKRQEITRAYQDGLIDEDIYKSTIRELDSFTADLGTKMDEVKKKLDFSGQWEMLAKDINEWVQEIGSTAVDILGSISTIIDNHYQAEIDKLQEYIDEYEEKLQEQQEITQEHADNVDSIESELSNARGDRRQMLIDQLNAEMAAQRASLAQEKKIEAQKEKEEEKQKKLEHDQAVAKKKMQLAQAVINMAMAISMAAVNSWPIPAIPMMALAAAAGAAQIAAIQSQNIPSYGSGGVIEGKSHAQGGVKVLGGRAEVEGGEYITNKVTTSKNVELLDYINNKRKKISLDDLVEFYGGNSKVKKNITSVRTKFADGGVVPTLSNNVELSDRMLTAFEDYSNRPVQVAVVDIIDKTQAVNEVKTLAGVEV